MPNRAHDRDLLLASWYSTDAHPSGASPDPHFEIVGSMAYAAEGNPAGPSAQPWYQLRDGLAYPVVGHPGGPSSQATFRVRDRAVFVLAESEPTPRPWFTVVVHDELTS